MLLGQVILQIVVLALIQGITEFLAHLVFWDTFCSCLPSLAGLTKAC